MRIGLCGPEVELDIISGFLMNPLPLLDHGEAELAIIHDPQKNKKRHPPHPTPASPSARCSL